MLGTATVATGVCAASAQPVAPTGAAERPAAAAEEGSVVEASRSSARASACGGSRGGSKGPARRSGQLSGADEVAVPAAAASGGGNEGSYFHFELAAVVAFE